MKFKFIYFILTISLCGILVGGVIPSLDFQGNFPILWRIFIFLTCSITAYLYDNIWHRLPKQQSAFLLCLAAITILDISGDFYARGLFSPAALLPGIVATSAFLYGWRRDFDPCALLCVVVIGAGIVAYVLPFGFLRELTAQSVTLPDGSWIFKTPIRLDIDRWHGISGNPDYAGYFATYGLLVMLPTSRKGSLVRLAISVILFFAIIASASRGVFIGLILSLLYLLVHRNIFITRRCALLIFGMIALGLFIADTYLESQVNLLAKRLDYDRIYNDGEKRNHLLICSLEVTKQNPLFGAGKDNYIVTGVTTETSMAAHIWFLEMSVMYGIPYAFISGLLFLSIFSLGRKANNDILLVRYSGIFIALLICSLFNSFAGLVHWFFIGYFYGLYSRYKRDKDHCKYFHNQVRNSSGI